MKGILFTSEGDTIGDAVDCSAARGHPVAAPARSRMVWDIGTYVRRIPLGLACFDDKYYGA